MLRVRGLGRRIIAQLRNSAMANMAHPHCTVKPNTSAHAKWAS